VEAQPEDVAAGGAVDGELGRDLSGDGQVALAAELERLELDRDRVTVLLPRPEAEATEREAGHARSYK
jgi:hypothetical protein